MATTYTPIATYTVSGTSTSEVQFASISGLYTDLIVIGNLGSTTPPSVYPGVRINSDTNANYSVTDIYGNGTTAASSRATARTLIDISYNISMDTTLNTNFICNFMNYSNSTTYKTVLSRMNIASAGTTSTVSLWRNTAAITNLKFYAHTGNGANLWNFANGSTFTLYGIKAA